MQLFNISPVAENMLSTGTEEDIHCEVHCGSTRGAGHAVIQIKLINVVLSDLICSQSLIQYYIELRLA